MRQKLKAWWFIQTNKNSLFFGTLFDFFIRKYKTNNCVFFIPKDLISRSFKTRFFFNTYEKEERKYLKQYICPESRVLEIGACLGVVSCITNKLLDKPSDHVVIEANPFLKSIIEKNKKINNASFHVENVMISTQLENTFYLHELVVGGSAYRQTEKSVQVRGLTIDELETKYGFKFDTLIMDIEGGEVDFIKENRPFLNRIKTIFIEIHGFLSHDERNYCINSLAEMHFKIIVEENGCFVWKK